MLVNICLFSISNYVMFIILFLALYFLVVLGFDRNTCLHLILYFLQTFVAYADCPDKFILKFHHGGEFSAESKTYVGGSIRYVDMYDMLMS